MLKEGLYLAENKDNIWDAFKIQMKVKETEKSYIFELVDCDSRYSADHIKMLFQKANRITVKKVGSGHAMRIWDDHSFTIYPYQRGIPYYFKLVQLAE